MYSFYVLAMLLRREGYWTQTACKVELIENEKRRIGRPSSPRWEIDLIAFKGKRNELTVVECKSFLDSRGVAYSAFDGSDSPFTARFKLFNDSTLRRVVFRRLVIQLQTAGLCRKSPKVTLALAAGRIASAQDRQRLKRLFDRRGWLLWDGDWIRQRLVALSEIKYEDDVATVAAKLLLRERTWGQSSK